MSLVNGRRVTIDTTATQISPSGDRNFWRAILLNNGANPIDLGDSAVVIGDGFELGAGDTVEVVFPSGDELFGVVGSGTEELAVLEVVDS